jgi:hypothetical protein
MIIEKLDDKVIEKLANQGLVSYRGDLSDDGFYDSWITVRLHLEIPRSPSARTRLGGGCFSAAAILTQIVTRL